ncbi:glycosyl hydrolase family 18 protein [Bacillus thermotolerans]|uniref:glycosyl hydrolase family 18 protein n=1 Tax=Bacillus thermotolerans TaxID=1221996 RepID=UPI00061FA88B|nr:glycosyl hydrolase family 18 protein [Bacillus thermotolerans]KKB43680.1 putative peptidoglycan hydrolase YvbX [Bacillus thermotolerans]
MMKRRMVYLLSITAFVTATFLLFNLFNRQSEADEKYVFSYIYNDSGSQHTEKHIEIVKKAGDTAHTVSPSYFNLNAEGMIENSAIVDPLFIKAMHEASIKVIPYLSDQWNETKAKAAFLNKNQLIPQMLDLIDQYNLDGVQIDIEHVTEEDKEGYINFVKELRSKLPNQKELSVAVAANPNGWKEGWHGAYEYAELAKYSDYLMLMAYDQHSMSSREPGPVASLPFVEQSIQYALSEGVPPEKILLGIPFYGRIWSEDGSISGLDVSLEIAEDLIEKYNGEVSYDHEYESPVAYITISPEDEWTILEKWKVPLTPGNYTLWYENMNSLKVKLQLVQKYNLKGTGNWSLGQETEQVWNNYKQWLNTPEEKW